MPLDQSCDASALEANIAAEIRAGKPRAQAVAIAQRTLRDACRKAGKPVPTRKSFDVINGQPTVGVVALTHTKAIKTAELAEWIDRNEIKLDPAAAFLEGMIVPVELGDGVVAKVAKRKPSRRPRTIEFLEEALDRARKALNPRDYAVIFQAARASAGGQIAARNRRERMTPLEKAAAYGARSLTDAELAYAKLRTPTVRSVARPLALELRRRGMDVGARLAKYAEPEPVEKVDRSEDPGVMIALRLPPNTARAIAIKGGEPPERLHVTLCYLGRFSALGPLGIMAAQEAVEDAAMGTPALKGSLCGIGRFAATDSSDGKDVIMALVDLPGLDRLRHRVVGGLEARGVPIASAHGYVPHVTLDYVDPSSATPEIPDAIRLRDLSFDEVVVSVNDVDTAFKLGEFPPPPEQPFDVEAAVEMAAKGELEPPAPPTFHVETDAGELVEMRADGEVVGPSDATVPDGPDAVAKAIDRWRAVIKHTTPVPFDGPDGARLMFVAGAPNELELARKKALVGDDAIAFQRLYLDPLGMGRADVAVGFAMPVLPHKELGRDSFDRWAGHLIDAMKSYPRAKVVALGRTAREVLKAAGVEHWSLPHPSAVRKRGDSGEVGRKIKAIAKSLDGDGPEVAKHDQRTAAPSEGGASGNLADVISEMRKTGRVVCDVIKAADEKQIVYAVVLAPYDVDLQREWVPPAEIESTAHGFLKKSRVIGFEHIEKADAEIVESWVEPYPSSDDYKAALENRPHRAFVRKFGDDEITSGTWMAGVQLGDDEWRLHKQGKLNAFSVGGFSFKTKVSTAAMPEVEFVELVESRK